MGRWLGDDDASCPLHRAFRPAKGCPVHEARGPVLRVDDDGEVGLHASLTTSFQGGVDSDDEHPLGEGREARQQEVEGGASGKNKGRHSGEEAFQPRDSGHDGKCRHVADEIADPQPPETIEGVDIDVAAQQPRAHDLLRGQKPLRVSLQGRPQAQKSRLCQRDCSEHGGDLLGSLADEEADALVSENPGEVPRLQRGPEHVRVRLQHEDRQMGKPPPHGLGAVAQPEAQESAELAVSSMPGGDLRRRLAAGVVAAVNQEPVADRRGIAAGGGEDVELPGARGSSSSASSTLGWRRASESLFCRRVAHLSSRMIFIPFWMLVPGGGSWVTTYPLPLMETVMSLPEREAAG